MELLSHIPAPLSRKLSKQEREEAAVIRIQVFWKNFLSSRSTGMVTPDLLSDSFFGSSPMIEMEGYYLFSFKIESITSGLKIGFSRSKNTLDSFDFISLDGTAHVSG